MYSTYDVPARTLISTLTVAESSLYAESLTVGVDSDSYKNIFVFRFF